MILKELKINTWVGDPTNCYIVFDEDSKETMVIDPAGDVDKIVELINILGGKLKYIYLTHCHGDHILGVTELKNKCGGKILIHREDSEGLNDARINLTPYIIEKTIELEADSRIDDNDLIQSRREIMELIRVANLRLLSSQILHCFKQGFTCHRIVLVIPFRPINLDDISLADCCCLIY